MNEITKIYTTLSFVLVCTIGAMVFSMIVKTNNVYQLNLEVTDLKKEIEGSVFSVYENARLLCKNLIHNKGGSLIFVGSSRGLSSDVGISGYSIGKNALIGLMKSFAIELDENNKAEKKANKNKKVLLVIIIPIICYWLNNSYLT